MGRPSLIGTAARTAVVAGTATAVAGRVAGRQQARAQQAAAAQQASVDAAVAEQMAAQQPAAPPPSTPAPGDDLIEQLRQLGELRDAGVLTEEEFAASKARLLGG
jgi:hypothetical protein